MTYPWLVRAPLVVGAVVWVIPNVGSAYLCCDGRYDLLAVRQESIPADGIIAIQIQGLDRVDAADQADVVAALSVSVLDASSDPVPGALELHSEFAVVLWRPTEPWIPGDYSASVVMPYNASLATLPGYVDPDCAIDRRLDFALTVRGESLPAATVPAVFVNVDYNERDLRDLETMVCCDDAFPFRGPSPVGSCPSSQLQGDFACVGNSRRVDAIVRAGVDAAGLTEDEVENLAVRLEAAGDPPSSGRADGDHSRRIVERTCLRFAALDLARGQVVTLAEGCYGDPQRLGDTATDPSEELMGLCEGRPYVCEVAGNRWDPERCVPWGPEPISGCSVDASWQRSSLSCVVFFALVLAAARRSDPPER